MLWEYLRRICAQQRSEKMKLEQGNVEAVKMCGEAVGAVQMREEETHEDEMWEAEIGEAEDHGDEPDAVVICTAVDDGEEIGAVDIVEMH